MGSSATPLVSIVVLNWNRIEDTLACIESVRKLTYKNTELIIVDNGSKDGSKETLRNIKDIIYVDNPVNRGFTGGHIDGLKHAKGDFILILNNDAVIDRKYIDFALEEMFADESLAAIGGRAYIWSDEYPAYEASNPYYAYQNINPVTAEGIFVQTDSGEVIEVNNVSGSGVVIRRSVIDHIGYLYDPYFAYYEETDLFARMKRTGYKVKYSPKLAIWHRNGSSSSSYFQFNQLFKNRFLFAVRNFETSSLAPFLRSYIKTGLRSTLLRFKNNEHRDLHRGFSDGFLYSMLTFPKAFISRYRLQQQLNLPNIYNSLLLKDQLTMTIVYDGTKKSVRALKAIVQSLEVIQQRFAPKLEVTVAINTDTVLNTSLSTVKITKFYKNNPVNIAWLSSKGSYVVFCDDVSKLDIEKILNEAVKLEQQGGWIAHDDIMQTPIKRELLIHHGGINPDLPYKDSLRQLCIYAFTWDRSRALLTKPTYSKLLSTYDNETITSIVRRVHRDKEQDRVPSWWEKFLERHYRVYQQRNLIKWLFSSKVSFWVKGVRCKNLVLFALTLNRQKFATELKHIRNEVIRSSFVGVDIEAQNKKVKKLLKHYLATDDWKNIPIFIICRDRVDSLKPLLEWFDRAGMHNITLIDNDSIYPPLVKLLETTSYQVIRTRQNIGHTVPWTGGVIKTLVPDDAYIVNDPDVIPIDECPLDAVHHMLEIHERYFYHQKVGFGLKIDDLPDYYHLKQEVINWESQFWKHPLEENIYEAGVDTTFAVYKPYMYKYIIHPSIRTGEPYTARHLPWYINSKKVSAEEKFYRDRVSNKITSWNVDELADRYKVEIKKQST